MAIAMVNAHFQTPHRIFLPAAHGEAKAAKGNLLWNPVPPYRRAYCVHW